MKNKRFLFSLAFINAETPALFIDIQNLSQSINDTGFITTGGETDPGLECKLFFSCLLSIFK